MSLENVKFTREHEWIKVTDQIGTIGITDYAQHELGDVVYVDLPAVGKSLKKGDPCANIESVKAVSDVYTPVTGTIVEVNATLADNPALVNQEPHGQGWLFTIRLENAAELDGLMDQAKYEEYLKGISGE